ncbi:MAG TPA: GntR family transcriptional regulator [Rectinemataceae bacterium]
MKIKKTSLPEEIVDAIKGAIKEGEWKAGERLPSESELAESFGVNRLTLRMALQKLNAQGILETRVGEGTFVRNFDFATYIGEVSDFYLKPEMIDNVCEFRKALEIDSARLAMERATPEELDGLERFCDEYDEVCSRIFRDERLDSGTLEELVQRDIDFHKEIVRLSKNTLYHYSFEVAKEPISRYVRMIVSKRMDWSNDRHDLLKRACAQHRIIYESIRKKDFETCKQAYLKMIDYTTPGI